MNKIRIRKGGYRRNIKNYWESVVYAYPVGSIERNNAIKVLTALAFYQADSSDYLVYDITKLKTGEYKKVKIVKKIA